MALKTEQEKMNNIHTGWEKFKETQKSENISQAFDQEIERKMMEANGLRPPLNESEKIQSEAELVANDLSRFYIKKAGEQLRQEEKLKEEKALESSKKRKYKFYMGVAILVSLGTAVLCKDKISGVVKDVVETFVDYDNQKLQDDYESKYESVEEITGMTPEEIMNKGRNY